MLQLQTIFIFTTPVMRVKILKAILMCLLGMISTKLILSVVKDNTMIKVEVIKEEDITVEGKLIKFLDGYIKKEEKKDESFLDVVKTLIKPKDRDQNEQKKTVFGQVKVIYLQTRSKIVREYALTSILLALVEHYLASKAGKYL